ncbi:MAG TPA: 3-hydroxyacyl-CoA dehydrogenase NAD-binding domain-containing protein [Flavitalea sp.]|nr:3-hydroxyacyl-CoA dehydrogenase NAD-binding domain-containing protein [Flavitalea sp.]
MFQTIAVVGSGTMGNGIAHLFAQSGYNVHLIDISAAQLEKALLTINKNLDRQIAKGIVTDEQKKSALARISVFQDMEKGAAGAGLVIEAATERIDLKLDLFARLDKAAPPECILASNTSSISITKIAAATARPGKVIGMHFMNPVPVMKLVEIINGYSTEKQVTEQIVNLSKHLGKTPCVVNDYPGFIANRILMPMINEAIYSLYEGVAGVAEIDAIMKLGMGHPMGPLQLADFIGLDTCHAILKVMYEGMSRLHHAPCPLLTNMVTAGCLGVKSGEGFYSYAAGSKELVVSRRFSS